VDQKGSQHHPEAEESGSCGGYRNTESLMGGLDGSAATAGLLQIIVRFCISVNEDLPLHQVIKHRQSRKDAWKLVAALGI
jgi:hypothetical protein